MEEFKKLWEEVLQEIVLPKGYLNSIRETLSDSLLISKAFQYCVIMRTKEGLEDFLNYHGPNEQFFVSNLTETLNLQNETEEKQPCQFPPRFSRRRQSELFHRENAEHRYCSSIRYGVPYCAALLPAAVTALSRYKTARPLSSRSLS